MEALRLRVKDVDFERSEIVVQNGKGGQNIRVMLPSHLPHRSVNRWPKPV